MPYFWEERSFSLIVFILHIDGTSTNNLRRLPTHISKAVYSRIIYHDDLINHAVLTIYAYIV